MGKANIYVGFSDADTFAVAVFVRTGFADMHVPEISAKSRRAIMTEVGTTSFVDNGSKKAYGENSETCRTRGWTKFVSSQIC